MTRSERFHPAVSPSPIAQALFTAAHMRCCCRTSKKAALIGIYNLKQDWQHQDPVVAAKVIPVYVCPSSSGDNPVADPILITVFSTFVGNSYGPLGVTNYAFCKGVTDAWCFPAYTPPGKSCRPITPRRGMFDFNWAMPIRKVSDGLSKTIALGDAASGMAWVGDQ